MEKLLDKILNDIKKYDVDKNKVLEEAIQSRLDKSLNTYIEEMNYVEEYLKNRKLPNLLRKL